MKNKMFVVAISLLFTPIHSSAFDANESRKISSIDKNLLQVENKIKNLSLLEVRLNNLENRIKKLEKAMNGSTNSHSHASLENRLDKLESTFTITNQKLFIKKGTVIEGNNLEIRSQNFSVNSGVVDFKGTIKSKEIITNSVKSKHYSPATTNLF